jgi:hypothetical protein
MSNSGRARKKKMINHVKSRAIINYFSGLEAAESKQNGKIKSRKTLENRAAAAAHILG